LLGNGDPEAAADQAGEVEIGGDDRDAAHGDGHARVLAAVGEGNVERGAGRLGVGEEHFEEVAHPEEQQGVGVLFF